MYNLSFNNVEKLDISQYWQNKFGGNKTMNPTWMFGIMLFAVIIFGLLLPAPLSESAKKALKIKTEKEEWKTEIDKLLDESDQTFMSLNRFNPIENLFRTKYEHLKESRNSEKDVRFLALLIAQQIIEILKSDYVSIEEWDAYHLLLRNILTKSELRLSSRIGATNEDLDNFRLKTVQREKEINENRPAHIEEALRLLNILRSVEGSDESNLIMLYRHIDEGLLSLSEIGTDLEELNALKAKCQKTAKK